MQVPTCSNADGRLFLSSFHRWIEFCSFKDSFHFDRCFIKFVVHDEDSNFDFTVFTHMTSTEIIPIHWNWVIDDNYDRAFKQHQIASCYEHCRVDEISLALSNCVKMFQNKAENIFIVYSGEGYEEYPPIRISREKRDWKDENSDYLNRFDVFEEKYTDDEFVNLSVDEFQHIYARDRLLKYDIDKFD